MKRIRNILAVLIGAFLIVFLCACFAETGDQDPTSEPELTLGELPDYSDAHAEDAPYIVFSSDLEPISEERIEKVRQAFYMMRYNSAYEAQTSYWTEKGLEGKDLHNKAQDIAIQSANYYKAILLNYENFEYTDHFSYLSQYCARYYGTIGGCEIISIHSLIEKEMTLELGGVKITNPNTFYMFACKGEEMIPLAEAYEMEWLDPIHLLLISKRNADFNSYWAEGPEISKPDYSYIKYVGDLEEISDEMIEEIETAMYNDMYEEAYSSCIRSNTEMYGKFYSEDKIKELSAWTASISGYSSHAYFMENTNSRYDGWRYYGIIGGYAVFADVEATHNTKYYHLGGYEIGFGNGAEMWVYSSDTGITELEEAYNKGMLTDSDIAKISERHEAYHDYLANK